MKSKLILILSFILIFGITSTVFAATKDEVVVNEPVKTEIKTEMEDCTEEVVAEQPEVVIESVIEEPIKDESDDISCIHMEGEWYYDLTEHEDGSVTYFRTCDCGAYEELDGQTFCELGGQYEDCDKGRHYWYEENGIAYCTECGYSEQI